MSNEVISVGGFMLSSGSLPKRTWCLNCKAWARKSGRHHLHRITVKPRTQKDLTKKQN